MLFNLYFSKKPKTKKPTDHREVFIVTMSTMNIIFNILNIEYCKFTNLIRNKNTTICGRSHRESIAKLLTRYTLIHINIY